MRGASELPARVLTEEEKAEEARAGLGAAAFVAALTMGADLAFLDFFAKFEVAAVLGVVVNAFVTSPRQKTPLTEVLTSAGTLVATVRRLGGR